MNLHAAQIDRLRLHGDARLITRDQQVADGNWTSARIDLDFHSAGSSNEDLAVSSFAEHETRLCRHYSGHTRVVRLCRSHHPIGPRGIEHHDSCRFDWRTSFDPLRDILIFGSYVSRDSHVSDDVQFG